MSTLAIKFDPHAVDVMFANDALHFVLADGREISAPLEWFPRLRDASEAQLARDRRGHCSQYTDAGPVRGARQEGRARGLLNSREQGFSSTNVVNNVGARMNIDSEPWGYVTPQENHS